MILITAFEPFGGESVNTSEEVLRRIPERIGGHTVEKLVLPVAFGKAAEQVLKYGAEQIFLLGEAGRRKTVTPETRAKNLRDARIPDNEGYKPEGEPIIPAGPEFYFCRYPVRGIVSRMREEGYAVEASDDAGTYVCNDTFYAVGARSERPVSFIHVPHRESGIGELAETVTRYIELAITALDE